MEGRTSPTMRNSACDWGVSDPLAVPKAAAEMRRRGHSAEAYSELRSAQTVDLRRIEMSYIGG